MAQTCPVLGSRVNTLSFDLHGKNKGIMEYFWETLQCIVRLVQVPGGRIRKDQGRGNKPKQILMVEVVSHPNP